MAHKMITFFGGTERLSEIHFSLGGGEGTQQGEGGEREGGRERSLYDTFTQMIPSDFAY